MRLCVTGPTVLSPAALAWRVQVLQGWSERWINVWSCVLEQVHNPSASRQLQHRNLQLLHDCCRQTEVWSDGSLPNTQTHIRPWNNHTAQKREVRFLFYNLQSYLQPLRATLINIGHVVVYSHFTFILFF